MVLSSQTSKFWRESDDVDHDEKGPEEPGEDGSGNRGNDRVVARFADCDEVVMMDRCLHRLSLQNG